MRDIMMEGYQAKLAQLLSKIWLDEANLLVSSLLALAPPARTRVVVLAERKNPSRAALVYAYAIPTHAAASSQRGPLGRATH